MAHIKRQSFDNCDNEKPDSVALYLFEMNIDGLSYGGEIPAKSASDAARMVKKFGAVMVGRLTDEMQERICPVCANEFPLVSKESPQPLGTEDEWPDSI